MMIEMLQSRTFMSGNGDGDAGASDENGSLWDQFVDQVQAFL